MKNSHKKKYVLGLSFLMLFLSDKALSQCATLNNFSFINNTDPTRDGSIINPFAVGDELRLCLDVVSYNEENINWIHGVVPVFPAGFTVLQPSLGTPVPTDYLNDNFPGQWIWTTISDPDINLGNPVTGWFFDLDDNGIVTDNLGDDGDEPDYFNTYCFDFIVPSGIANGQLEVFVSGDGTSGDWEDDGCLDPNVPIPFGPFYWGVLPCDIVIQNITVMHEGCPAGNDGSLTITATCPSCTSLEYSIGGAFQAGNTFTGLSDGIYTITVRDSGNLGCTETSTRTINNGIDSTPPVITCPTDITINSFSCTGTLNPVIGTATATDNCDTPIITSDAPATFPIGNTTVIWTATDNTGNSSICSQVVTVSHQITFIKSN